MEYYLAIDIGASSGRHMLCHLDNNKLVLEEMYRFSNNVIKKNDHYYWDIDYLFEQVIQGIQKCVKENKVPKTLGIDTWAVDYALIDANGNRFDDIHAYRDNRVDDFINKNINQDQLTMLYQKTGIQFQKFNTLYQLASDEEAMKDKAVSFLMVPDYLNYLLTDQIVNEYTNLSTTQLLDIKTNELDDELLQLCHIKKNVFARKVMPGTSLGSLSKKIQNIVGCDIEVVVPATHDTGSAYMASIEDNSVIISSGTWSLLGIETMSPIVSQASMDANFTNEGGYDFRYRFLKNIMGLWIIQEVSRNLRGEYSFAKLVEEARKDPFEGIFDVNDERFLKPDSMILEIKNYFEQRQQEAPQTVGEIAYCVYNSLAHCYKEAIEELETITNKHYSTINIIGGGCQNELLNELIAKVTKRKVIAGPIEATALGNILAQLLGKDKIANLQEGRQLIRDSFEIKEYKGEEL